MKRIWSMLMALLMAFAASPAWAGSQAVLCADFTLGDASAQDAVKRYAVEIEGELSAEALAKALSELTGLDFSIAAAPAPDGLAVDWAKDSTLVAGLDDRAQKEEFFMYDVESLSWFMMDSLRATLKENLDIENVYYTMDGGKDLTLENLSPVSSFEADQPYMGSVFYCAQSNGAGQVEDLTGPVLVGNLPRQAELVENTLDGAGGYREVLKAEEGAVTLTLLRRAKNPDEPEDWTVERAMQADYPDLRNLQTLQAQPVSGHEARRARFETGENEDTRLVDALVFETDEYCFAFAASVAIDDYYGLAGRYEEGEMAGLIQGWMDSLELFDGE